MHPVLLVLSEGDDGQKYVAAASTRGEAPLGLVVQHWGPEHHQVVVVVEQLPPLHAAQTQTGLPTLSLIYQPLVSLLSQLSLVRKNRFLSHKKTCFRT